MASCAMHGPKPVTLELGGKSPQLVLTMHRTSTDWLA